MNAIKNILVPTDFSKVSKNALAMAATIAEKAGADLHLLNVIHVPVIDPYTPVETINSIKDEEERVATQELAKIALDYPQLKPKIYVKLGFFADEITRFVNEHHVDLVVMGTTGSSGVEEAFFGSNASSVVGRAKCPVLSIPDEVKKFTASDVVYAADLHHDDADVIKHLLPLIQLYGSNLHLLHIRNNDLPLSDTEPEDAFKNIVAATGYNNMSLHVVKNENTIDGINEFMDKSHFDVIAMATHHRGFFSKMFHKSLTKKMVNHAHIPVLTYFKEQ